MRNELCDQKLVHSNKNYGLTKVSAIQSYQKAQFPTVIVLQNLPQILQQNGAKSKEDETVFPSPVK